MKSSIVSILLIGLSALPIVQAKTVHEPLLHFTAGGDYTHSDVGGPNQNNSVSLGRSKIPHIGGELSYLWTVDKQRTWWIAGKLESPSIAHEVINGMQIGRVDIAVHTRAIRNRNLLFGGYVAYEALFPYISPYFFKQIVTTKEHIKKTHIGLDWIVLPLLSNIPYPLQITFDVHYTWNDSSVPLNYALIAHDFWGATLKAAADYSDEIQPFVMLYYRYHGGAVASQPKIQQNLGGGAGITWKPKPYCRMTLKGAYDYHTGLHADLEFRIDALQQASQSKPLQRYLQRDMPRHVAPITFLSAIHDKKSNDISKGVKFEESENAQSKTYISMRDVNVLHSQASYQQISWDTSVELLNKLEKEFCTQGILKQPEKSYDTLINKLPTLVGAGALNLTPQEVQYCTNKAFSTSRDYMNKLRKASKSLLLEAKDTPLFRKRHLQKHTDDYIDSEGDELTQAIKTLSNKTTQLTEWEESLLDKMKKVQLAKDKHNVSNAPYHKPKSKKTSDRNTPSSKKSRKT